MRLSDIYDQSISPFKRRRIARHFLQAEQRKRLPGMRASTYPLSKYYDAVTLVAYTFPSDERDFELIEFAIRQSWSCLGMMKAVIIADRHTKQLDTFATEKPEFITVQIEPELKPGDVYTMCTDCIERLHTRFTTPYCLVVQDDGFPLSSNLGDFLWKYDYIGSPPVRDVPAQHLVDIFRLYALNGGFSLRSKKICKDAASQWRFWKRFVKYGSTSHLEDVFYTNTACRNPLYRIRNRFPSCKAARKFSLPDFDGGVDIRAVHPCPFGVHGPTAAVQLLLDWPDEA